LNYLIKGDGKMILEKIHKDKVMYMKAKDAIRLSAIRMLLADVENEQIKLGRQLNDEDVCGVIYKLSKQLNDSLSYLTDKHEIKAMELTIQIDTIRYYLPKQLTLKELEELVLKTITEHTFNCAKDIGQAMKILLPLTKGKADSKNVSALVKAYLG
jgi:uncharacterized protein YqeY